ncbi:uncharacterized protein LOC8262383 isoform X1 [Ricinus communis]|uniref:uncharacterized protein LOC8262383 isoform X1 n=1 Tax=Ricinus communis TaxID=3988 RepID=UPI000772327C|nr:uncharacterized protein LOC8262383 isoform X1 [Ricinus communis]XP_015573375.1 uncharacterized protein LOC8262383 isoform X1 [Ricinus communis]|eukprot:XP_015573374.1 uncharacterized protein LOC8262383 isoform X1 [Ricinus communis]
MVCSLGSGRMAVMARILAAASLSQTIREEVGQQKLAAQCIYREFHEADEANLLDEDDMHVYGLKPMTDPLDLVCCNACKKPVKASHFVTHTELCRLLSSAEETMLEHGGSIGHRKPPRKERRKLLSTYTYQATPAVETERPLSTDADYLAGSESQLDGQPIMSSSFSMDAKRNPACIDVASIIDGKGVSPENTDHSACVMPPPTKRSKLVSSRHLSLSNDPEAASGLTKIISTQDTFTYVPAPLATKIYYSQRNNRLRSAIASMYHSASAKGLGSNVRSPEVSQENSIQLQASPHQGGLHEPVDDLFNKERGAYACKPDQVLSQSSEVCLDKSGGCIPASNFSSQFAVDNILSPQPAPVGLLRTKYIPKPYSFAGNSGQSLGTVQQPSGSVPVL